MSSSNPVMKTTRLFVLIEAVAFLAAALTHFGILAHGYRHKPAGTAESVIGCVLFAGWLATFLAARWTNRIGLIVQVFALVGTLVGLYTIAIGIGPRTTPDLVFHAGIVIVLVWGLAASVRAGRAQIVSGN